MDEPRTNLRRSGWLPFVAVAAAVVLGAAGWGAWRLWGSRGEPQNAGAVGSAPEPAPAGAPPAAAAPEEPVDAAGARSLLAGASANERVRAWLAGEDALRRGLLLLVSVADGQSPRKLLAPFAPASPFSVAQGGGRTVIAPESYARYDGTADAIASVDAQALAAVYRRAHVPLEAILKELGYPAGSLDRLATRALHRIESTPVPEGDVVVEGQGGTWYFADARLEKLGAIEKHLLRLGPANERRVQAKARELRDALRLSAQVASGGR